MNKTLLLLVSLFLGLYTFGQAPKKITGKVVGSDFIPKKDILVSLVSSTSNKIIKSEFTDSLGKFEFKNPPIDSVFVAINEIGFAKYKSDIIAVEKDAGYVIGEVVLSVPTNELEAVAVVGKKQFITRGIDRVTIIPEALISNAGLNAYELLLKSPGVSKDSEGNIQLKGRSGVLILVDNKQTFLGGEDLINYLRGMSSESVASIELIPIPPAQYDAAGSGGVININQKRSKKAGFSGSASASYGQGRYARTRNNLNLNFNKNKLSIYTTLGQGYVDSYHDLFIYRQYQDEAQNPESYFNQRTYIRRKSELYNARIGGDYYLNDKTTIGVAFRGSYRLSEDFSDNTGEQLDSISVLNRQILAQNTDYGDLKNSNFNLNFRRTLDSLGSNFSINANYIRYNSQTDQDFNNQALNANDSILYEDTQRGILPSLVQIYALKADLSKKFKKFGTLEFGGKSSLIDTDNKAEYFTTLNNVTDTNYNLSNQFLYEESIHALYVNYNRSFKKVDVQLGLRSETTVLNGNQLGNKIIPADKFKRDYTSLFPSVFLGYHLDTAGKYMLVASYGRRISRPNFGDLNPFVSPLDQLTFYGGNPFLLPSISDAISLSLHANPYFSITASYSQTKDDISETIEIKEGIYYSRPGNIGSSKQYRIAADGNFEIKKWWSISAYSEVAHQQFKSELYTETLNSKGTYIYGQFNNNFTFKKGWSAELSGSGLTDAVSNQFKVGSRFGINAAVQKKILKNKGSFKVSISDIFFTNQVTGTINNLDNALAGWVSQRDTRILRFSLNYRFGSGKSGNKYDSRSTDSEEDRLN